MEGGTTERAAVEAPLELAEREEAEEEDCEDIGDKDDNHTQYKVQ